MKKRRHVIFCEEHYNPLGIVRTLGEYGVLPYVIVLNSDYHVIEKSKYIKKKDQIFHVDSVEQGYKVLMENFGKDDPCAIVHTSDDTITAFLDERYDELKDHFFFYNGGGEWRIT